MKKLIYLDYENDNRVELTTLPQAIDFLKDMPLGEMVTHEGGSWFYITAATYKDIKVYPVMQVGDYDVGCGDYLIDCFTDPLAALKLYELPSAEKQMWEMTWQDEENIEWW